MDAEEYLTGISIHYEVYLHRILFHTNRREYGPFGGQGGLVQRRLDAAAGRRVVGFKGRHWDFIDSIQLRVV